MVVCKYFLQGTCRFGENCRFEHPGAKGGGGGFGGQNSNQNRNQNRYGALSGNNRPGGGSGNARKDIWQFNADDVPNDLGAGKGRPIWILSSYGPGKNPPVSLLQDNEFSPEEIRARFYELAAQGKQDEADREAITLWSKAEQDINQVVNNARDVEKFVQEAEKKHPNRDDFTQVDGTKTKEQIIKEAEESSSKMSGGFGSNSGGGFGSNNSSSAFGSKTASAFGQPSQPSAFGKPAFGQSGLGGASPSAGGFGQAPSGGGFGSGTSTGGFGQASGGGGFDTNTSSGGFGKPAFGQSGFGQPAQTTSAFGQPSQPTSAFGQPSKPASAFGQPSQPVSAFGQPSQPASAFGQASQPTSAFGQPSQPSGFGQPAFGSSGGFGSNAPKNPFAPASAAGGFGQSTSAFGQSSLSSSGFGQTSQPQPDFGFGTANQPGAVYRPPPPPPTPFGTANQPGTVYRKFDEPTQTLEQALQAAKGGFGSDTSAFGQPTTASSGFGSSTAPAFGQTGFGSSTGSAFGQAGAPTNPFGVASAADQPKDANMDTASRPQSRANPFGPADAHTNTSPTPHPLLDRSPHALHYTETLPQGPTQKNPAGKLTVYRGQPVTYENNNPYYRRPDTRQLERIWFPDGAAEVEYIGRDDNVWDTQGQPDEYTDDVVDQYRHLFEQGTWRDGKMPLVPPLRAWAVYDF